MTAIKNAKLLFRKSILAFIPNNPIKRVEGASVVEKVVKVFMFLFILCNLFYVLYVFYKTRENYNE